MKDRDGGLDRVTLHPWVTLPYTRGLPSLQLQMWGTPELQFQKVTLPRHSNTPSG